MKKKIYAIYKSSDNKISEEVHFLKNWEDCKQYIKNVKAVQYKGFASEGEARAWINKIRETSIIKASEIEIYIDGSFKKHQSIYAGWAFVVVKNNKIEYEEKGVTLTPALSGNIDGEVLASTKAIIWAKKQNLKACIIYDYQGVESWANQSWSAKSQIAKNYQEMIKDKLIHISFKKVKAHSGNAFNERADELAKLALDQHQN